MGVRAENKALFPPNIVFLYINILTQKKSGKVHFSLFPNNDIQVQQLTFKYVKNLLDEILGQTFYLTLVTKVEAFDTPMTSQGFMTEHRVPCKLMFQTGAFCLGLSKELFDKELWLAHPRHIKSSC